MAVVQMMKFAGSATFGELASKYFQVITAHLGNNGCNRVDVVFDRYDKEDSIKEAERSIIKLRGANIGPIHASPQEMAKLHLQPREQDQPKGISWQHMERDGKGEACGGSEIGVGRVFHEQRGHASYHTK